jgi:uncharacterized protein YpuA (DUF1002 family)
MNTIDLTKYSKMVLSDIINKNNRFRRKKPRTPTNNFAYLKRKITVSYKDIKTPIERLRDHIGNDDINLLPEKEKTNVINALLLTKLEALKLLDIVSKNYNKEFKNELINPVMSMINACEFFKIDLNLSDECKNYLTKWRLKNG